MVAQGRKRTDPSVNPVALLTREHEMILDRLRMIEVTIGSRHATAFALTEPDRETLRELFRFFTGRVGIHFKREAVLVAALSRNRDEQEQFDGLLLEHRALKADAAGIARTLGQKTGGGAVPSGVRSFIRRFRGHLSCEERILFVLAERRLTAEQKLKVSHRMLQV